MTEVKDDKKKTEPAQARESEGSGLMSQIGSGALLSGLMGLLGTAAGAGWPGVIALALVGLSVPFAWSQLVRVFNAWADKRDLERAGADAGNTAVDLANQGRGVSQGLDRGQLADPPTDGFQSSERKG